LRGGRTPNYDAASVAAACSEAEALGLPCRLMIDASHGNSEKKVENQSRVIRSVCDQMAAGEKRIFGVMIESHLTAGRQDLLPGVPLVYGQSITDACLGWEDTAELFAMLAEGVRRRRSAAAQG
jgi:3-deoxy-7-phosphoheptulonate synthase